MKDEAPAGTGGAGTAATPLEGETANRRIIRRRERTRTFGSLRRRAAVAFSCALIIIVVGFTATAASLTVADHERNHIFNTLDRALVYTAAYGDALAAESSGARLYAQTGAASALETYKAGAANVALYGPRLRTALAQIPPVARPLAALHTMVASWQDQYLRVLIANPGPAHGAITSALIDDTAFAFNRINHQVSVVDQALSRQRTNAVDRFDTDFDVLGGVVAALCVTIVVLLGVLWFGVRRTARTLALVGADSRRVTEGDLDHVVAARGVEEIADLARDIDAMRARVVEDLHALEQAHRAVGSQQQELAERSLELARSNRDLEQFAYVASHDLQEPLRKVAAFCQLLSDRYRTELDERGQQYISFAVDGAKRMQQLVNDLLAFSRVGRHTEDWQPVSLNAVLDTAVGNLQARIDEADATIERLTPLPAVRGDITLLTALFQNLIANSVKFHGEELPVATVAAERNENRWEITIADNGIGIEPQYAERVFVIFQRLHTRDRYEGTGIGLALCRKIVEFHGGQIYLRDDAVSGTSITFTLPVSSADPEDADD